MDLVERTLALDYLASVLDQTQQGQGQVVLVGGEAGIGKTVLVDRFVRQHERRLRVLWGACDALITPRPLGAILDMALHLPPELRSLLQGQTQRSTLFTALLSDLQRQTTIMVIDDTHWADDATLDLLRFLGRRIARTQALLVLTYRDDELGSHHPLRTLFGDLGASETIHRLTLTPLSVAAVTQLVGHRPIDSLALHQLTAGNPFFVAEVLASSSPGLPPTVRDAVLARAARLTLPGYGALQAAAVLGPRIDPTLLSRAAGASLEAIEECLTAGMLVAQEQYLTFRHALTRQAILEEIPPPRRIGLHRLALSALTSDPVARTDPARLAYHAAGANDRAAVLAFAPLAAEQASTATSHRSAAALYRLALDMADGLPASDEAALLEAYARQCTWSDLRSEAIASRQRAADLRLAAGDQLKHAENLSNLALALVGSERWAEARSIIEAAVQQLETLPPGRELALAYRHLAWFRRADHELAEAISLAERAVTLAEATGQVHIQGMAYDTLGGAWLWLDFERGRRYLEHCLTIARAAGLEGRIASVYANLGVTACMLHRFDVAEHYLATGIEFTEERDLGIVRFYMQGWQAMTNLARGRWETAERQATAVAARTDISDHNRIAALVALGRLRSRRGDPAAAAALDEALTLATRSGDFQHLAPVHAARAEAAWLAGAQARTRAEAVAVLEPALLKQHPWLAGELTYWCQRAGQPFSHPTWLAEPFALQLTGDWSAAATAWRALGCPFEEARALADGDAAAQALALAIFDRLGATAAAARLRHHMRARGVTPVPRGPRPMTRANHHGLTARQLDVLRLVADGLTNVQIGLRLSISPRTVEHHVAASMTKLAVSSRQAAIDRAGLSQRHAATSPADASALLP